MKLKRSLKSIWIPVVVFGVLLFALVYVGKLANDRFNEIVYSLIESKDQPSPTKGIERIRALLGESELTVKAYTLTKDDEFMTRFYDLVFETIDELEAFQQDSTYYSIEINNSLDTLDQLAMRRIGLFETIIETGDEFRVERAMNKVSSAITNLNTDLKTSEDEITQTEKSRGLFKRRTSVDTKLLAAEVNEKSDSVLNTFQSGLAQITAKERQREANIRQITLILSKDGEALNAKIDSISALINDIEMTAQEQEAERIAAMAASSSRTVEFGIIISAILVMVFSVLIVIQIRSSNRFSKAAKRASQEAVNLAQAKESFVANVSHELRTPLNSIIGFADLIGETNSSTKKKEYEEMIKSSAAHLGALVNDLLDWSKIDAGKFNLELIPFSPQNVIDEVKTITYSGRKTDEVDFIIKSELKSSFLQGDPTRLRQILINLLGNAFKFTNKGSVTLSIKEAINDKNSKLLIDVIDTGIGIPPEKMKNIFGDFEQVDASTSRKFGGSGLGLAITKKLVELHEGKINIQSVEGQGTTFHLEIPYLVSDQKSEKPEAANKIDLSDLEILIVDDTELNRNLLEAILGPTGCNIQMAHSAAEALKLMQKFHFDFGLFDIKMPQIDGFELIRRAKAINSNTKYIALTAAPTSDVIEKGMEAGYMAVLDKPIERTLLFSALSGNPISKSTTKYVIESKATAQCVDLDLIDNIFENDLTFRNEMLLVFIKTFENEKKPLKKAIESSDLTTIEDISHKLIPACRQIGAKNLLMALERIKNSVHKRADQKAISKAFDDFIKSFDEVKVSLKKIMN